MSKCPVCGSDNKCNVANNMNPNECWCMKKEFPQSLSEHLGEYDSCICENCYEKLNEVYLKKEAEVEKLLRLDELFCNESQENGAESWRKYFSKSSVMLLEGDQDNLFGVDAIYDYMLDLYSIKNFSMEWTPEYAKVSDDLSIGYTFGRYVRVINGRHEYGKYMNTWENFNGEWKITLDVGN